MPPSHSLVVKRIAVISHHFKGLGSVRLARDISIEVKSNSLVLFEHFASKFHIFFLIQFSVCVALKLLTVSQKSILSQQNPPPFLLLLPLQSDRVKVKAGLSFIYFS